MAQIRTIRDLTREPTNAGGNHSNQDQARDKLFSEKEQLTIILISAYQKVVSNELKAAEIELANGIALAKKFEILKDAAVNSLSACQTKLKQDKETLLQCLITEIARYDAHPEKSSDFTQGLELETQLELVHQFKKQLQLKRMQDLAREEKLKKSHTGTNTPEHETHTQDLYHEFSEVAAPVLESKLLKTLYTLEMVNRFDSDKKAEGVYGTFKKEKDTLALILSNAREQFLAGKLENVRSLLTSAERDVARFAVMRDYSLQTLLNFRSYLALYEYDKTQATQQHYGNLMLSEIALYNPFHPALRSHENIAFCLQVLQENVQNTGMHGDPEKPSYNLLLAVPRLLMSQAIQTLQIRKEVARHPGRDNEQKANTGLGTLAGLMTKLAGNGQTHTPAKKEQKAAPGDVSSILEAVDAAIRKQQFGEVHTLMSGALLECKSDTAKRDQLTAEFIARYYDFKNSLNTLKPEKFETLLGIEPQPVATPVPQNLDGENGLGLSRPFR